MSILNIQTRSEPNAQRNELRLAAEQAAKVAATSSFVSYTTDERSYTSAEIADAFERACAFISAADDLPANENHDRPIFLAAGVAALCDALHRQSRRAMAEPAAMTAPARLVAVKAALLKRLDRNPIGLPSAWWFCARSLLRPSQPEAPQPPLFPMLAFLRLASASLYAFGEIIYDAPRLRTTPRQS